MKIKKVDAIIVALLVLIIAAGGDQCGQQVKIWDVSIWADWLKRELTGSTEGWLYLRQAAFGKLPAGSDKNHTKICKKHSRLRRGSALCFLHFRIIIFQDSLASLARRMRVDMSCFLKTCQHLPHMRSICCRFRAASNTPSVCQSVYSSQIFHCIKSLTQSWARDIMSLY